MNRLKEAYVLLRRFKEGRVKFGRRMSKKEIEQLLLLKDDLLPGVQFLEAKDSFSDLVIDIAKADSHWNRELQVALVSACQHNRASKVDVALLILKDFVLRCPSTWYQGFANIEISKFQQR